MIRSLESRLAKLEEIAFAGERFQVRVQVETKRPTYVERGERGRVILWLDAADVAA